MAKDPKFVAARDRIAELMMGNLSMSPEEAAALDEEKEARYAQIKPSSLVPASAEGGDEVEEMDADEEAQIEETETDADLGSLPKSRFRTKRGKSLSGVRVKAVMLHLKPGVTVSDVQDYLRRSGLDDPRSRFGIRLTSGGVPGPEKDRTVLGLEGNALEIRKVIEKFGKSLDNPKKGDLFDWYGEVRIVTRVNKDGSIDTQRPHVDSFGKEMLLDGKTFKRYELGHMRRVSGYWFPKPGFAVAK